MYIPSASELNDLRDVRPRLHRPLLSEWVAFMKSLSEKGLALVPPEEHARRIDDIAGSLGIDEMLDIASRMAHDMMTKFRVYSMSKRWDNLSMWEWYASKHRGYCLEFANAGVIFGGAGIGQVRAADPQHVGAVLGQRARASRPRKHAREVEHPDAGERTRSGWQGFRF